MAKDRDIVDVLVIGAGASGGAFTWSLADAGFDVMCLDQGGWPDALAYPSTQDDWEVHRQTDYNPDPNLRRLPEDYPVNVTGSPLSMLMYNAIGGTTIHWTAHFPRLHPSDFRVRTLDGVADDWPISYRQLEPFYDLNDRMMGVAGVKGDPAYPAKSGWRTPPIPLGKLGQTVAAGFDRLGWHWWPSDAAIITEAYEGRSPCNNCGPCDIGCTLGAKASADVAYWPKAQAKGAVVTPHARVREVTVGKDGLVDGAIYYDAGGGVHRQKGRIVVVACNGIGTPRLLLNSRSSLFPHGLANSGGLVGKNLMFHPVAFVTGVFDEDLEGYKGPAVCSIFSHEFYETDLSRGFVRGYGLQLLRGSGPVHTAVGGWGGHLVPWGAGHRQVFDERLGHICTIDVISEDLPEEHNRVDLDPDMADGDGIPAPRVVYALGDNTRKMIDDGISRSTEVLRSAGAKEVLVNPLPRDGTGHNMGTARMGLDGDDSVVDPWGRCHDVKNLFIVDGSIFVTAGAVNPTSTIQALALYIADNFKRSARHLLD